MKVIKAVAYSRIKKEDGCVLRLSTADVCAVCVERLFWEKLYQVEHPRLVSRFDEVAAVEDDETGYHISKAWLKEAYGILQELFPNWRPPSTSAQPCPVCEALLHISKEDKREYRKQAEEEKHMHDNALNGNNALLEDVPCAIVPSQFVRSWRQWLLRPSEIARPENVDNAQFICEHAEIWISMTIVKRSDWDASEELYPAGPLVAAENTEGRFLHELDVWAECRLKRRTSPDMKEIAIRILTLSDPTPTPQTYSEELPQSTKPVQTTLTTYSKREWVRYGHAE
ncbi:hypothetical protein C8Q74DRAFT_1305422 [Fomes fomentarius]|nr:hypothetical protein C8Q74DRAFT_1305150 [Fomes fomentarius]KAI0755795.1 hypothetical protein C8Q74DRAFT_1305422 [Fomes fomentarius]